MRFDALVCGFVLECSTPPAGEPKEPTAKCLSLITESTSLSGCYEVSSRHDHFQILDLMRPSLNGFIYVYCT